MLQTIKCDSIAIMSNDCDVLVFCEIALAENFEIALFSESEFTSFFVKASKFNYAFIDLSCAKKTREKNLWNTLCANMKKKLFVLVAQNELHEFFQNFSDESQLLPYPFTNKTLFYVLNTSKKKIQKSNLKKSPPQKIMRYQIPNLKKLTGDSAKIDEIKEKILLVADTDTPLIFYGESGTGKTMSARIVHELSRRKEKPFVNATMGNSEKNLIETKLFGSVRGAFTDAINREGLFRAADGGTLFMDEIADLSFEAQSKILRVIESGVFRPIGSDKEIKVDVRLIFATNANLELMVKQKTFREDLYWRIADFPIRIPPLRERSEDIPTLIENTLQEVQSIMGMEFKITNAAVQKLMDGEWPGNFRQFKACIRRAALLCRRTCIIDQDAIIY